MHPLLRLASRPPALGAALSSSGGVHVSGQACPPCGLGPRAQINNGAMTLLDLDFAPPMIRTGVQAALRRQGWRLTIAGALVRCRHQVELLDRPEPRSALTGRDARLLCVRRWLGRAVKACSAAVLRKVAMTGGHGLFATDRVHDPLGTPVWGPPLPDRISVWSAAGTRRPWFPVP